MSTWDSRLVKAENERDELRERSEQTAAVVQGMLEVSAAQLAEIEEIKELRAQVEALRADAERYRWLRERHWNDGSMVVCPRPHEAIKLGYSTLSSDRLDAAIDAAGGKT